MIEQASDILGGERYGRRWFGVRGAIADGAGRRGGGECSMEKGKVQNRNRLLYLDEDFSVQGVCLENGPGVHVIIAYVVLLLALGQIVFE